MRTPALPASTVVLLRQAMTGPLQVFMVKRPARSSFAGAHVFPGGQVEPQDWSAAGGAAAAPEPLAYRLAAIRELFEEAGVLLVRDGAQRAERTDEQGFIDRLRAARHALLAGESSFAELCAREDWRPAPDLLVPLSRWVTPEAERRRFDTRFYAARFPSGQEASADGAEAIAGEWIGPAEAVARHDRGDLTLAPPTLRTLDDLVRFETVEGAISAILSARYRSIAPRVLIEAGTRWLLLPGDALFPAAPDQVMPPPTRFVFRAGRWHMQ